MEIVLMTIIIRLTIIYITNKKHILNRLLIIECITIICIIIIFLINISSKTEIAIIIFILISVISERILGISLILSLIRTHRNDFIKTSLVTKL
jgi:NADH-ubiquinone oxidoreductase chain 4L